jgi:spore germination protein YaaH
MCFARSIFLNCCCPPRSTTSGRCLNPRCFAQAKAPVPARRKSDRKPSEIPLNSGEGLRAAYYIQDDPASYASLKEHIHQIDLLFPQWLHATSPAGNLMATNNDTHREYPVVEGSTVHDPDEGDKVKRVIQAAKEDTEVFPHLNNYNAAAGAWDASFGAILKDAGKRASLRKQIVTLLHRIPGLSWPFAGL